MKRSMSERSLSGSTGASSRTSAGIEGGERPDHIDGQTRWRSAISSGVGSRRELLAQRLGGAGDPGEVGGPVERNPDGAALPGQGGQDRLPDPPDRVGDELDALVGIELPGGGEQPEVALADEVAERQPPVLVLLGHRDDEAEVSLDQLLHGFGVAGLHQPGDGHFLLRREQRGLG